MVLSQILPDHMAHLLGLLYRCIVFCNWEEQAAAPQAGFLILEAVVRYALTVSH